MRTSAKITIFRQGEASGFVRVEIITLPSSIKVYGEPERNPAGVADFAAIQRQPGVADVLTCPASVPGGESIERYEARDC